jgi:hypothetical protein
MSSSTPDLVPSNINEEQFYKRNDLHIYINNLLFFGESIPHCNIHHCKDCIALLTRQLTGFRTGPNVTWGNLCACIATLVRRTEGYTVRFRPREPYVGEVIHFDLQSRQTFGDCKAYDFQSACISHQHIGILFPLILLSSLIHRTGGSRSATGRSHLPVPRNRSTTSSPKQIRHSLQNANSHINGLTTVYNAL